MNEKITQLWNKAAESTAAFPSGQNNSWETQVNFMEKFAELIVRECMDIAREVGTSTEPEDFALDRCYEIETKIKEHFGVEE